MYMTKQTQRVSLRNILAEISLDTILDELLREYLDASLKLSGMASEGWTRDDFGSMVVGNTRSELKGFLNIMNDLNAVRYYFDGGRLDSYDLAHALYSDRNRMRNRMGFPSHVRMGLPEDVAESLLNAAIKLGKVDVQIDSDRFGEQALKFE